MTRCPKCDIIIFNDSEVCPLCQCVTQEFTEEETEHIDGLFGEHAPYPNVGGKMKALRFVLRLVLFIFVVAEVIMVLINYYVSSAYPWSIITGISFLYIYLFLLYWVSHDNGFAAKVGLQLVITMVALYLIDYFNGNRGWALQWAIPGLILLGDGIVLFVMMLNRSRWASYLLLLMFLGLCAVTILILYYAHVIHRIVLPMICAVVTMIHIFGVFVFGGRSASREIKRRFHI